MKLKKILITLLIMGAFHSSYAENTGKLCFASSGEVDAAIVTRVMKHVEKYAQLATEQKVALDAAADLEALLKEHTKDAHDSVGLIVLAKLSGEDETHSLVSESNKVMVINVGAFAIDDAEKEGRRIERLVMRGLGTFLGMGSCPNPHCALFEYKGLKQLDSMGRNYCPPHMMEGFKALDKAGIKRLKPAPPQPKK